MQDINLLQELEQAQIEFEQNAVIREVEAILHQDLAAEQNISARIQRGIGTNTSRFGGLERLDSKRRFDIETIEKICTKYRLRFLESDLFKGDIPSEAIREVKRLESSLGMRFDRFSVIAPAERFDLKDSTKDPILMAELPNRQFYYIFHCRNFIISKHISLSVVYSKNTHPRIHYHCLF